ncbi:MAG: M16 family metallopeptidase [Candidatus Paceibacterota bacterium]
MRSKKKTLSNGVRLVTIPMKDNPTVTVLVMTEAGTVNEPDGKHGLAHFLEHMAMKGGEKYKTPYAVSSTLDSVGASSNAFTGQEYTGYYAKGHPKHFSTLLDVISDVYLNPRVDEEELSKERGVIVEEINMYKDTPKAYVQDLFYQALYGDQPVGRHPLGTIDTVKGLKREDFLAFMKKHYVSGKTLVVVAGGFDQKKVEKEVSERYGKMPSVKAGGTPAVKGGQKEPRFLVERKETDQLHIDLGVRALKASDKTVPVLMVLNSVLSGGMSGRLFQKLREEMGVCYYVRSVADLNRKHGLLAVMAGVDPQRFEEVIDAIMVELKTLRDELVDEKELKKAKEHLIGRMSLDLESSDSVAEFFIEQEILTGVQKTPQQIAKEIRAVTSADVRKLARRIFTNDRLAAAVVGRDPDTEVLKKKLSF